MVASASSTPPSVVFPPRRDHAGHEEPPIATPPSNNEPRINERIRAREVRLVGPDGSQIGIKPLPEALAFARELDLDLVEVAAMANPPVCRVMDFGKFKYEAAQQAKESRRKTTAVAIKEMKYRPKIGTGDFETKTRQVEKFLGQGHKVKVTIMFRGREMQHPELGHKILERVAESVNHFGKVEAMPKLDGRNMVMVLAPDKRAKAAWEKAHAGDDTAPHATDEHDAGEPTHAEDEDAQRRGEALQDDGQRQADPAEREHAAQLREEAAEAEAPPVG
jgi:translation initiation factor IF-3